MSIKTLNASQVTRFDTEYVRDKRWEIVKKCIDRDFPDGTFVFLDLGGGNGVFTDKILENYPNARATIVDNSEFLLSKNKNNPGRKEIICESIENIGDLFPGRKFDIIFMNWILHHLVADSYSDTLRNIEGALQASLKILNDRGRISIFENMYDGLVFDNLPGRIIYYLTSCKKLSTLMRRLGANTAGVGVCFRSKKAWLNLFDNIGMKVAEYGEDSKKKIWFPKRLLLHMRNVRVGHFWIGKKHKESVAVKSPSQMQLQMKGGLRIRGYNKKKLTDKPLVSIITVTLNSGKYVQETIQSVINQTYDNVEYIIIDGCSTDNTLDIIRKYDDKIDYWVSEPDSSMYDAINKGINLSSGDIIAVLNSDDKYVNPDVIEQAIGNLSQYPDIDGVYGDLIRLYPTHWRYKKVFQVNYKEYLLSRRGTFVPHMTLFIRRDCIRKTGLYNISYRYAADYDFILKCLKYCKLRYINRPFTYFRLHDESITASGRIRQEKLSILNDHQIDKYPKIYRFIAYERLWSKYVLQNLFYMKYTFKKQSAAES